MTPSTFTLYTFYAFYAFGFALLCALSMLLSRFLCRVARIEKPNFQNRVVPAAVGLTFLFVCAGVYLPLALAGTTLGAAYAPSFLLVSVGFGILGVLDDKYGTRDTGGFRGHITALFRGKPTTGALKLIGGGALALVAAFLIYRTDWLRVVLAAAITALGANALNLFDTRPARAQFAFALLFAAPVTAATLATLYAARFSAPLPDDILHLTPPGVLLGPALVAAALEWWPDARGKAMMGDTGSNLLGAVGGLALAVSLDPTTPLAALPHAAPSWSLAWHLEALVVLLAINIAAEHVSFSAVIEKNRFLRAVDRSLGVR